MSSPKPHFTPARRAGDFIYVSGQLPFDAAMQIVDGGIETQTRACIDHISRALESVGSSLAMVVKNMVWLTDPADFPVFNRTYAEYFPEEPPARATVGTTLMVPGALIEIEAIAYDPL
ncbi:MAG: RidA family protein [Haliea sp.]|nr:RidA family protein [Haliea sp.]